MSTPLLPLPSAALALLLLFAGAQPATPAVVMPIQVVSSGGAQVQSPSYRLSCTVGQASIGALHGMSYDDHVGFWYPTLWFTSEVTPHDPVPTHFALSSPLPNPSSGSVQFNYAVPNSTPVSIRLYDASGRDVLTPVDRAHSAGTYSFRLPRGALPAGVYFCSMKAARFSRTVRVVLIH